MYIFRPRNIYILGEEKKRVGIMVKISEFQTKDVVNIIDGKKLGSVQDLEIDLRHGKIDALVVPVQGKFLGLFGSNSEYVIPWENIIKIGLDVILVKLEERSYRLNEFKDEYEPFKKNNS